jgi:hypothetical protein
MAVLVITPEIEADVQRLAERMGKTPTEAVATAVRKELSVVPPVTPKRDWDRINALLKEIHSFPVDYSLTEDEILGYDEFGVPEQPYLDR